MRPQYRTEMVGSVLTSRTTAAGLIAVTLAGIAVSRLAGRRKLPAAGPLLWIAVVLLVSSVVYTGLVGPTGPAVSRMVGLSAPAESLWLLLTFNTVGVVAAVWFVFALQYTGRSQLLTLPTAVGLATLPVALLVLSVLLFTDVALETIGSVRLQRLLGLVTYLLYALLLIGTVLVVRSGLERRSVPVGQWATLAGTALVPAGGTILGPMFPDRPFVFPAVVSVSMLLLCGCLLRYRPFETLPITQQANRGRVVAELSRAVLVVDDGGAVRDLNAAAEQLFDVTRETALGSPLSAVDPALRESRGRVEVGDRTVSVEVTPVVDDRDRQLGRLLICRDVTDRVARKRRIQLLTRVLTDTVRDRMSGIDRRMAPIADDGAPSDEDAVPTLADAVWDSADSLLRLVDRTRTVERTLDGEGDVQTAPLPDVVETAVTEAHTADDVPIETAQLDVAAGPTVPTAAMSASIASLVEDAARRGDTHATVSVTRTECDISLTVEDDGSRPAVEGRIDPRYPGDIPLPVWLAAVTAASAGGTLTVAWTDSGRRQVAISFDHAADREEPPGQPRGESA